MINELLMAFLLSNGINQSPSIPINLSCNQYIKANASNHQILTPNGSKVDAYYSSYVYSQELVDYDIENGNRYPKAVRLEGPSTSYNCHSYAWHDRGINSTNNYWINNPEIYYKDNSFIETDHISEGNIIVYYDSEGRCIHSAVIRYASDTIDNTKVISKWGSLGVYYHNVLDSPYKSSTAYTRIFTCSHHSCTYNQYSKIEHISYCSYSKLYFYEDHNFIFNQRIEKYECIDCGFKSKFILNDYKKSLNFRDALVIEALLS